MYWKYIAPLAQLDRASVYGTEGYRFESCEARFVEFFWANPSQGGSGEIEDDDGGVIVGALLGAERLELGENTFNSLLGRLLGEAAQGFFETLDGIELPLSVAGFDHAVGVKDQTIAGLELMALLCGLELGGAE